MNIDEVMRLSAEKFLAPSRMTDRERDAFARACEQPAKRPIVLTDPVLDATDAHTRLLLLAEYWQRKAIEARKAFVEAETKPGPWHFVGGKQINIDDVMEKANAYALAVHDGRDDDCVSGERALRAAIAQHVAEAVAAERKTLLDLMDDYAKGNADLKEAIRARADHETQGVRQPCGECHLTPGERCDICGARADHVADASKLVGQEVTR